jgi:hypothetical protein
MKREFFSRRWSLYALVFSYVGIGAWVSVSSSMTVNSALILGIITLIPALILLSFSRVAGVAAAWVSVPVFFWSIRAEAFPQGAGAPMTVVPIVLFGWPVVVAVGAIAAAMASVMSRRRRDR